MNAGRGNVDAHMGASAGEYEKKSKMDSGSTPHPWLFSYASLIAYMRANSVSGRT